MTEMLPPLLPRRHRLAWLLLWFALLGALVWSAGQPRRGGAPATFGVQRHHPVPARGGADDPAVPGPRAGGGPGETAFRQP